jgi:sugar phosphate isomerase/epimerase
MNNDVIMHINYMEQGQSLSEICERAVQIGFDGVEFRRDRGVEGETPEKYLSELAVAVEKSGLKKVLFGSPGPNLMQADKFKREQEVERYIDFFKLALKYFPMEDVNNTMSGSLRSPDMQYTDYTKHGSFIATEDHYNWASEGFKTIGDFGLENGLAFAFETHMGYLHDLPVPTKKLLDMIDKPNVGANFDYGNISYFPDPPSAKETIEMLGDKFTYFHLKNYMVPKVGGDTVKIPCALEEGIINNREVLKILKARNYTGNICVEAPRPGDREWFAKKDLIYIKEVMAELG